MRLPLGGTACFTSARRWAISAAATAKAVRCRLRYDSHVS